MLVSNGAPFPGLVPSVIMQSDSVTAGAIWVEGSAHDLDFGHSVFHGLC